MLLPHVLQDDNNVPPPPLFVDVEFLFSGLLSHPLLRSDVIMWRVGGRIETRCGRQLRKEKMGRERREESVTNETS